MKILGIETSCDETACAVVENGQKVLSSVIASQIDIHKKTGGVVPEVAARQHILQMTPVLDECIKKADLTWDDIDAVAVTQGPGLIGSLIIGTVAASTIARIKDKKLLAVHHIKGHIYSSWLEAGELPQFPILVLTVSGGHNELILFKDHYDFTVLGKSRDDAAGEAFDKVARLLGMSYPGGPAISKKAVDGDCKKYKLPRAWLEKDSYDFSFSGLKTAVRTEVQKYAKSNQIEKIEDLDEQFKKDMSASFQEAVVEVLSGKVKRALDAFPDIKEVHVVGGVSANLRLRESVKSILINQKFRCPKDIIFCTDNAAMIAGAAYFAGVENKEKNILPASNFSLVE